MEIIEIINTVNKWQLDSKELSNIADKLKTSPHPDEDYEEIGVKGAVDRLLSDNKRLEKEVLDKYSDTEWVLVRRKTLDEWKETLDNSAYSIADELENAKSYANDLESGASDVAYYCSQSEDTIDEIREVVLNIEELAIKEEPKEKQEE